CDCSRALENRQGGVVPIDRYKEWREVEEEWSSDTLLSSGAVRRCTGAGGGTKRGREERTTAAIVHRHQTFVDSSPEREPEATTTTNLLVDAPEPNRRPRQEPIPGPSGSEKPFPGLRKPGTEDERFLQRDATHSESDNDVMASQEPVEMETSSSGVAAEHEERVVESRPAGRKKDPPSWKRNQWKTCRSSGQEYTIVKGLQVRARKVQPRTCKFNCPRGCWRWTEEERQFCHDAYCGIKQDQAKRQAILALITKVGLKDQGTRNRQTFHLMKGGEKTKVCRS
ncbi:unnamed protein product, partial [Cyprideis torosa]